MQIHLFEDSSVDRLGPAVAMRPACRLLMGSVTLEDALSALGPVSSILRPSLARHLAALGGRRIPLWGPLAGAPAAAPACERDSSLLLVNARLAPSRAALAALRMVVERGQEGYLAEGDSVAAALVRCPDPPAERAFLDRVRQAPRAEDVIRESSPRLIEPPGNACTLASLPHHLLDTHERVLEEWLGLRIDSGGYAEIRPGLFAAAGTRIEEPVAVRRGPVVVEAAAHVGPFVCLDGPVWIGPATRVNPHSWIREGTAAGAHCRLGGEIEASVFEPFANKPHDGFVGHSHMGGWVNLAAGTTTANLKSSYGVVRMRTGIGEIDTGRQFVGAFLGELARTAVHTTLGCGLLAGPATTLWGVVTGRVPPFQSLLHATTGGSATTPAQAAATLARMMARRGLEADPADLLLLEATAAFRG
jgi:UDP-N-acetylglucosamine diphosphorylase/glucosamine-1-phosphate N-acetyltransferase